jgi:hypothetical protein
MEQGVSMNIELNQDGLCLKANQIVKMRGDLGHSIVCERGTMWLTQHGDPRDIILRAGEAFTLDHAGPALIMAVEPGAIRIVQAKGQTRTPGLVAFLKSRLLGARRNWRLTTTRA